MLCHMSRRFQLTLPPPPATWNIIAKNRFASILFAPPRCCFSIAAMIFLPVAMPYPQNYPDRVSESAPCLLAQRKHDLNRGIDFDGVAVQLRGSISPLLYFAQGRLQQ